MSQQGQGSATRLPPPPRAPSPSFASISYFAPNVLIPGVTEPSRSACPCVAQNCRAAPVPASPASHIYFASKTNLLKTTLLFYFPPDELLAVNQRRGIILYEAEKVDLRQPKLSDINYNLDPIATVCPIQEN